MSADHYILGVKLLIAVELHIINRAGKRPGSVLYDSARENWGKRGYKDKHLPDFALGIDQNLTEMIEGAGKRHIKECVYFKSNVCGLIQRVIQDWATSKTADIEILQVFMDEVEPCNPLEPPRPYKSTEHSSNHEINPNNHSQAKMKELILKMTFIGCSLIVTPNVQYKCHEGHIFCEYCKGSRPVSHCSK